MKWMWLVMLAVVVVVLLVFMGGKGPDLSKFEYLKEPQIITKPAQKMMVLEVTGDPSGDAGKAVGTLFKMFFKVKGKTKGMEMAAPRARWPKPVDTPREEWVGIWAMPVPESVETLPQQKAGDLQVRLETWEYGEVAEILHIGPYSEEPATIEKLHKLIDENGYKITGPHEEEYLKGPGMFGKGNPAKYYTIIRYPVEKKWTKKVQEKIFGKK